MQCQNCNRQLGKLEKGYILHRGEFQYVVCCECNDRLKANAKPKQEASTIQAIERTSKRLKARQLIFWLAMLISSAVFVVVVSMPVIQREMTGRDPGRFSVSAAILMLVCIIVFLIGLIGYGVTRWKVWWHHG